MKFFVTDAQLAAMRLQAGATVRENCTYDLRRVREQYESEIARLRADRDAELARLADPHAEFIAHLRATIAHWQLLYTSERQRADISVDQRLAERGLGPVTLPPRPLAPEQPMDVMAELMKNVQFANMGSADGVDDRRANDPRGT